MLKTGKRSRLAVLIIMLVFLMVSATAVFANVDESGEQTDDPLAQKAEYYVGMTDTGKVIKGSLNPNYNPRARASGNAGDPVSKTYGGYTSHTQIITVDGHTAYCIEPEKNVPSNTDYQEQVVNNAQLRTVLYYGYGGNDFAEFLNNVEGGDINSAYMDTWMAARIASGESISNPSVHAEPGVRWLLDHATAPDGFFNVGNSPQNSSWVKSSKLQETGWYTTSGGGTFTVQVNGTGVGVQFQGENEVHWTNQERTTGTSFKLVADKAKDGQVTINVPTTATGWAALLYVPKTEPNTQNVVGIGGGSDPVPAGQAVATFRRQEAQAKMKKVDKDTNLITGQGDATLEGAVFGLFAKDDDSKKAEGTVSNGAIDFGKHFVGDYYVKELKAPAGYQLDETKYPITLENPGEDHEVTVTNNVIRGGVKLQKNDGELDRAYSQGDATLAGAEFSIVNKSANAVVVDGKTFAPGEVCKVITTDANGVATTGANSLPYGTYEITETKASTGYKIDSTWKQTFTIRDDSIVDLKTPVHEPLIRGGVRIEKWDKELNKSEALGGAKHGLNEDGTHLEGIELTIKNTSAHNVLVEGKEYKPGDDVKKIYTRWDETLGKYVADTAANLLPYGSYSIRETKTTDSYLLSDGSEKPFQIREDGVIVTADTSNNALVVKDQVKRGDVKFVKIGDSDSVRLSVPWLLTNTTTGEKHIIATDKNGMFSSEDRAHSLNTNANDALMAKAEAGEVIKQSEMVIDSGLWFSQGEAGSQAAVNDALSAMPYGKYTLTELRCEANDGYTLQEVDFWIYRDSATVDLGTITNDAIDIWTEALDKKTDSHMAMAEEGAAIGDEVEIEGIKKGEKYTAKGRLVNAADGSPILVGGKEVTAEDSFTAFSAKKKLKMDYKFDASSLAGKTAVVFVDLYQADGRKVASHADLNNEDQSIHFPQIQTTATDNSNNDHYAFANESVTITDEVAYSNLLPGETYTMRGQLMLKSTGKALIEDGKPIVAEKEFEAKTASGKVELEFTFNASLVMGDSVVVFEDLEWNKHEVAIHADINDEGQTVHYPEIGTTATDNETGLTEAMAKEITLKDVVSYKEMPTDREVKVFGTLMDKETAKPLLVDGKEVTSEVSFIPPTANGKAEVLFTFDATGLEGKTVVVFEKAYVGDYLLASHEDIDDEGQTIRFPKIQTTALGKDTNDHYVDAGEETTIIDTVDYENLTPGNTYKMSGKLMIKNAEGLEEPLLVDGKEVTAEQEFVPEEAKGVVELSFTFNSSALVGKTVVVFEDLYRDDVKVGTHADIDDVEQSVHIIKIGTQAWDKETMTKIMTQKEDSIILDTVNIDGFLYEDETYTLKALVMDKATAEALDKIGAERAFKLADVKPLEEGAQWEMITDANGRVGAYVKGTIDVEIQINALEIAKSIEADKELVAFESLYTSKNPDTPIASHEDINDEGQTVVVKPAPKPVAPETGDDMMLGAILALVVVSGAAVAIIAYRRKKVGEKK